jgi:hypothetical protein
MDGRSFNILSFLIFLALSVSLLFSQEKGAESRGEVEVNRVQPDIRRYGAGRDNKVSKGPGANNRDIIKDYRSIEESIEEMRYYEKKTGSEDREISEKNDESDINPAKAGEKKTGLVVKWHNNGKGGDNWNGPENKAGKVPGNEKKWPGVYGYGMTPGLNLGLTIPSFAYGKRYKNVPGYSAGARFERYGIFGFVPEAVLRYSELESRDREGKVDSSMSLTQFSVGARYNYKVKLPSFLSRYGFFRSPVTLYARASEGITRVAFTSDHEIIPIVEYINTIEVSTGFTYPVYNFIEAGLDFGYRHIATREVPLQVFYLMVVFGVRV